MGFPTVRPAELGQTQDPRALVPGNPEAIATTVAAFQRYGNALVTAGQGLRSIDDGGWKGAAADGFRAVFDGEPSRWIECGDAFNDAASALNTYVGTLTWAQGQAAEAIRLYNEGEAATEQAKAEHQAAVKQAEQEAMTATAAGVLTVPRAIPFHDPGEDKRAAARDMLMRAREQVLTAGDQAERIVGQARDLAPPKPKWWQKVGEFIAEVGKGALEATIGLAEFAWSISSVRMLVDPAGYIETVSTLAQSAVYAVQNPAEFGKAVLDWDTWKENPGRALGRLLPDLVLTAATAGGGAAVRGARGVRALDNLADVAKKVDGDGPVVFRPRSDLTPDELNQMQRYVDTSNRALREGQLSPTGRVSTSGELRAEASEAARLERARAAEAGTPYDGVVGHAPDTTWSGKPDAFEWHDQTARVNSSLGAQARNYPIGFKPSEFILGPMQPK